MADWSSVPLELVGVIANKFSAVEDYTAFTTVCRSYRFATKGYQQWRPVEPSRRPPWLLLCCHDEDDNVGGGCTQRGLLSIYRNHDKFLMNLHELHGRHCWGTPYGWILTLSFDRKFHLFNPLTHRRIVLPDPNPDPKIWVKDCDLREYYVHKATLIKRQRPSSSDDQFIVVTTDPYGNNVNVMRRNTWEHFRLRATVIEFICFKGQIYALCLRGKLLICSNFDDDANHPPTMDEFVAADMSMFEGMSTETYYIVESMGELLLVLRYANLYRYSGADEYRATSRFEAYKLNFETRRWIQIYDLGDCALFVGSSQSMCLPQPEDFNCRKNCIYYTDDNYESFCGDKKGGKDMGIYNFEDKTIYQLYEGDDSLSIYSTPTWFIPSFT